MRDITLSKSAAAASIRVLGIDQLPQVLALQEATRAALPEDQKRFVLPQSRDYFEKFLRRENGLMLGVICEGDVIAQMVVMGPLSLETAIERNAITRNEITFHYALATDIIVVAKSMAVHPEWRGNDLAQIMLEAALNLPLARAADHMFAQISTGNVRSWELFLKQGFGVVAAVVDPVDNLPRFIVQKPSFGFALHQKVSATSDDAVGDFAGIARLTQREALVGTLDPKGGLSLMFQAGIETATAWSEDDLLSEDDDLLLAAS